ncbi:hypothetical protein DFS34DRAFT_80157 [Phlyctochytrium arcticum]|nr:hypothetical protein DFS34DRAFT_80157 [Phlyctochytrium arcticum]
MNRSPYHPVKLMVPAYHVDRDYMRNLWIAPLVLLSVYMSTLIAIFALSILDFGLDRAKEDLKRTAKSIIPGVDNETDNEASSSTLPPSVAIEAEQIETVAEATEGVGSAEVEEHVRLYRRGRKEPTKTQEWLQRVKGVSRAAWIAFLLSTLIATIATIPVEYVCRVDPIEYVPELPVPPSECGSCLGNAATLSNALLAWTFLGLSSVLLILNLFAVDDAGAAGTRLLMTFIAEPLVLASIIYTLVLWGAMHRKEC